MMEPLPQIKKGIYLHFKGNEYEVLDVVRHSETTEPMVLYRHLGDDSTDLWVRPFAMFTEEIKRDGKKSPRFRYIRES